MPRASRTGAAVLFCAALLITVGCAPHADWTAPLAPSWTVDAQLLSDPVILDNVVVAYTVGTDGDEQITAWRLENGKVLWHQIVLPGTTPRGVDHTIAALEDDDRWLIAALVPRDEHHDPASDWSRFTVFDATTGVPVYRQLRSTWFWGERPSVCNEKRAFCLDGHQYSDVTSEASPLMFAPGDDAISIADYEGAPFLDGGFSIGGHINVKGEDLRYGVDGEILWSRDYEEVFVAGANTSAGWAWRELNDTEEPRLLGVGYDATAHDNLNYDKPFDAEVPLGRGTAVGLDPEDGATLWRLEDIRPCAVEDGSLSIYDDVAVLCRFSSGTFSWHWDGSAATNIEYADVEQEMIGVDVETGEVLWKHALDNIPANYASSLHDGRRFRSAAGPIITVGGTARAVDPEDGTLSRVDEHATLLCAAPQAQVELSSIWDDPTYLTADIFQLCDAKGEALNDGVLSRATLDAAGFAADEPAAINTVDGLALYAAED